MREDLPGYVALQESPYLLWILSLRLPALHVGPGFWVMGHPGKGDGRERPVETPVASAVEAVALGVARGGGNGAGAGERGESGLGADTPAMGPGHQDDGRVYGTYAHLVE